MLLDTKIPFRYIIKDILPDALRVFLISLAFQLIKHFYSDWLPLIPLPLPALLGGSISLLLAFKIGQSYDRWWEARKVWGAIVNESRTLVVQANSFLEADELLPTGADVRLKTLAYRQIAWCYSLGQALRGQDPLANAANFLPVHELDYMRQHTNKPLALLTLHSLQIKNWFQAKSINAFQQVQLDSTLVRLCEAMGQGERINGTVFPSSYRLLIYLFIYLFIVTLSLGLVETIGLWEIPLLLSIAVTYFLLERTARYLQDPFSNRPTDTPVTAIARTIEINLKEFLRESRVPEPAPAQSYYLM
ncbi:bestrophin family protein [Hymenobacter sp. IS2118]|uniref:bestrophin family protein n=1 Tax=Hymenobacter sp. IS2118 TaxID=1505605 RepID=UPI000558C415|nr:bestrophin family ion channel [Hymenobacter sp. IS2118]